MIIKSLELENFRNYNDLSIQFNNGTNVLYGDNAQGKTNILEAIYVCSTTKSHRASKDRELIKFDSEEAHIRLITEKSNIDYKIDMHLKKNKTKGVAVNGIPIKKTSELFGIVNIIFFSPEDLSIIKNGPSERRRFIDLELCQLNPLYFYNLQQYHKVLNQRNNLMKQIQSNNKELLDTLSIWDIQLVRYGNQIIEQRKDFINKLNEIVYEIHRNLTGNKEELMIKYEPNVLIDDFELKLVNNRDRDIRLKTTSLGPHRDDISFYIKDIDIRKYGSQGQQRTAALSLKMAEIELVKKLVHENPILLLDDVLSELDSNRQQYLLNNINDIQTIITCTGLDDFINKNISIDKVFKVVSGKIINN